jgi:hypothetical protein
MLLGSIFLISFIANLWLSWSLGSLVGVGVFLTLIPISIMMTVGGGLALGLVGMIFGKRDDRSRWQRFMRDFLRGWAWLVCIIWVLPWISLGGIQFANNTAPATLPKITISNGEKTVIFQSMMHIGSASFYDEIQRDMENLKGREFVFFYEWVESGTPESIAELSQLTGINISEKMYSLFAEMSWLAIQDPERYKGIIPSTNVDISTDEIIALAREANIENPAPLENDILLKITEKYPELNDFQKRTLQIISRGFLNILLRTYTNPALEENLKTQLPIFDIILDKRNSILAKAIEESPVPNIYIHYGALHYAGVREILEKKDPRWREIARTNLEVIR